MFLRDYDICPSLINKSVAFQVYLHTRNSGECAYEGTCLEVLQMMAKNSGTSSRKSAHPMLNDFHSPKFVGKYFTFFKFVDMLVKCAKVTFSGASASSER
jgi:hypothetical protein